jgi:hypothetical protein
MLLPIADAGIPMLFFHLPAMVLALVPVVAVEWVVAHYFAGVSKGRALKGVFAANCFSTLLGFPLFWLLSLLVLLVLGSTLGASISQAPHWVEQIAYFGAGMIYQGPNTDKLQILIAGLSMLVPAFLVSVYSERWILESAWPDMPAPSRARFSWLAHLCSYPVLVVVWLLYMNREW